MDSLSVEIYQLGYLSGIDAGVNLLIVVVIVSLVVMFGRLAQRS